MRKHFCWAAALLLLACSNGATVDGGAAGGGGAPGATGGGGEGGEGGEGGLGGEGGEGGGGSSYAARAERCAQLCNLHLACEPERDFEACVESCIEYADMAEPTFARCIPCLEGAACEELPDACADACTPEQVQLTITGSGWGKGSIDVDAISSPGSRSLMAFSSTPGGGDLGTTTMTVGIGRHVILDHFVDTNWDGGCDVEKDQIVRVGLVVNEDTTIHLTPDMPDRLPPSCELVRRVLRYDVAVTVGSLGEFDGQLAYFSLLAVRDGGPSFVVASGRTKISSGGARVVFDDAAVDGYRYRVAWRVGGEELEPCSSLGDQRGGLSELVEPHANFGVTLDGEDGLPDCELLPGHGEDAVLEGTNFHVLDGELILAALVGRDSGVVQGTAVAEVVDGAFSLTFEELLVPDASYRIAFTATSDGWPSCWVGTEVQAWWADAVAGGVVAVDGETAVHDESACGSLALTWPM